LPATMSLENVAQMCLERQITLARAVLAALSLVALLETSPAPVPRLPVALLSLYLAAALGAALGGRFTDTGQVRIPLAADLAVLALFLCLAPSVFAFWFLLLFGVFALATRGNMRTMGAVIALAIAGIVVRLAWAEPFHWRSASRWAAIGLGMLVSGLGIAFLGARERQHLARQQLLDTITGLLRFERGLTESIRQMLGELALAFDCEQACLATRDEDLDRVFVWRVRPDDTDAPAAETLPLSRSDTFFLDAMETSVCWNYGHARNHGFGWDRRTGRRFRTLPPPPESTRGEFAAHSLLAVTFEFDGRPAGRVLLINPLAPGPGWRSAGHAPRHCFSAADLRWLEQIVRHIGPPLENLFLLRHLRNRAIESERSRISRDLHDGILQTLLSLKIQLGVLRQKLPHKPDRAEQDLVGLEKTVQQESEDLRRMVTDLRPLRLESADMRELMLGFAERFRSEHDLQIDLFIEDRDLRLPDRICRELFQIYREALHNIKKHAHASHVVVKLGQDEAKAFLVVDDNGLGFGFSGRYTSEELDQLRLGPISIKERTRSVGGTLTLESNPGHGARLTIEIPTH
jgi:signal transduction histidine kinase